MTTNVWLTLHLLFWAQGYLDRDQYYSLDFSSKCKELSTSIGEFVACVHSVYFVNVGSDATNDEEAELWDCLSQLHLDFTSQAEV